MYFQKMNYLQIISAKDLVKVPVAFAKFPKELPTPPRSYIEKDSIFNVGQKWQKEDILLPWNNPVY